MIAPASKLSARTFAAALAACLGAQALLPTTASAHPHIWVTTRAEVIVENGTIVALRHAWTFDEFYSAAAIDGLDQNNDGVYSRDELAELAQINVEALKDFAYFTFPKLAGQDLALGQPKDYWLSHDPAGGMKPEIAAPVGTASPAAAGDAAGPAPGGAAAIAAQATKSVGALTLHLTLPLAKPVLVEAKDFSFSVGDPSFFIAFELAGKEAVRLTGGPSTCRVVAIEEKPAEGNASPPGALMAPQPADGFNIAFFAATEWTINCGAG